MKIKLKMELKKELKIELKIDLKRDHTEGTKECKHSLGGGGVGAMPCIN